MPYCGWLPLERPRLCHQNAPQTRPPNLLDQQEQQQLLFFYKLVEGPVPAMLIDWFLKLLQTDKRQIKPTRFQDLFVKKKKNHTKPSNLEVLQTFPSASLQCWTVQELFLCQNHCPLELPKWWPSEGTEQYRNSFFVKTIACWNYRNDDQVKALNNTGTLSLSKPLPAGITGVMTKRRHWTIQELFLCQDHCPLESPEWWPSEGTEQYRNSFYVWTHWNHWSDNQVKAPTFAQWITTPSTI